MLRKMIFGIMAIFFAAGVCLVDADAANIGSVKWGVHAQPGFYCQTQVVSIKNSKNGYVISCNTEGGDATFKETDISLYADPNCLHAIPADKVLTFTCSGTSIEFQPKTMPQGDKVYVKIALTYGNGTTASFSGTIRAN